MILRGSLFWCEEMVLERESTVMKGFMSVASIVVYKKSYMLKSSGIFYSDKPLKVCLAGMLANLEGKAKGF